MVYSDYTRASPYPAFPDEIQIIRLRHFGYSAANDKGRALAARWCTEKCHGGIPYYPISLSLVLSPPPQIGLQVKHSFPQCG